jgi:hypothetical protein
MSLFILRCLVDLQCVDGLGELVGALGAAAECGARGGCARPRAPDMVDL